MSPLLNVSALSVTYTGGRGTKVQALSGVSFRVDEGEIVALVGESGSGKSTAALSIVDLLKAQPAISGSIQLQGEEITDLPRSRMRRIRGRRIGMVFQDPFSSLDPVRPVGWQIEEAIGVHLQLGKERMKQCVELLLHQVGIADTQRVAALYPHQLSGGMRQRILIAIAISCRPALLIADEPTTALDVTVQRRIMSLLMRLRREAGMAVLLITHNLGVVAEVADRVYVLRNGQNVEEGNVSQVFGRPSAPYTQELLRAVPRLRGLEPVGDQ